ncbi:MAG: efflux RND transporter periplasmic adaptor subunit [Deltaproteobacteria bacterium]|nr:efflux RND transporter periplasmic adaptor subunit [Deltaproteobacteria bacterium]
MIKKIAIPVIILCLIGAVTTYLIHYFRNQTVPEGKVFVSGNIEATEFDLSFRLAGQIKTLPIEEGDLIQKDQLIATLDTDSLEAMLGSAKSEIIAMTAVLDELEEGTRKEVIQSARALAKAADSRLKNARDEYERYYSLYKESAISASAFDTKQTAFKVAQEEFNNASERLAELEKGPREQEIIAARGRLEKAKWELQKIELDIQHSTVRSPVAGAVLVKANELGEVVLPGATVATVAEIDKVWLKGYIGEKDLGLVKLGQRADITTDSFPGKFYQGVVTFISSRAEFTPKNVQTREERIKQVYRVKITIPNPKHELKIGMPSEGYILVNGNSSIEKN